MRSDDEPRGDQDPEIGPEVPEADAIEQRRPAVPDEGDERPETIPPEVPEADALEQSRGVPPDDETGR